MNNKNIRYERNKRLRKVYESAFLNTSKEVQYLVLISTKSLHSEMTNSSVILDLKRLEDELKYFEHYSNMSEKNLLIFFIPLIISNRSFSGYSENLLKVVDVLTKSYKIGDSSKYEYLIGVFCYDFIIRSLLLDNKRTFEYMIESLKDELINYNIEFNIKSENVKFQMAKIKYIELIYKLVNSDKDESKVIDEEMTILDLMRFAFDVKSELEKDGGLDKQDKNNTTVDVVAEKVRLSTKDKNISGGNSVLMTIIYLMGYKIEGEIENYRFIENMSNYILKVKNLEIKTKRYSGSENLNKFSLAKTGDIIEDPILNKSVIIDKKIENEKSIVTVETKTGRYDLKF